MIVWPENASTALEVSWPALAYRADAWFLVGRSVLQTASSPRISPNSARLDKSRFPSASVSASSSDFFYLPSILASFIDWPCIKHTSCKSCFLGRWSLAIRCCLRSHDSLHQGWLYKARLPAFLSGSSSLASRLRSSVVSVLLVFDHQDFCVEPIL